MNGTSDQRPGVPPESPNEQTVEIPAVPVQPNAFTNTPAAPFTDPALFDRNDPNAPRPPMHRPARLAHRQPLALPDGPATPRPNLWTLLGFTPDARLMDAGMIPTRVKWGTWRYEPREMVEARAARIRHVRATRQLVAALKTALSGLLRLEPHEVQLEVPLSYKTPGGDPVWLALPDDWSGAQAAAVVGLIEDRLGGKWNARWHLTEHPHYATFTRSTAKPKPPKQVEWELSPDQYRIYVGKSGTEKVFVETETETPHWGVSAGSGGGKTTTLTLPAIHWRAHGGLVDIIDLKQESFNDSVAGISGFRVHTDVVSAVKCVAEFLTSAKAVTKAIERGYPAEEIPPRVLLIDEFGSFVQAADIYWKRGLGEKGEVPVYSWFHVILMQGRTKNHRVVVGTHDYSQGTFKSTAARDLIGTKILIGPTSTPKWVTAFGHEFKKINVDAGIPGRAVIGQAGKGVEEFQIAYITPEDTRAMCSEFEPAPEWFDNGEMAPWITERDVEVADREAFVRGFLPGGRFVTYDDDEAPQLPASHAPSDTPVLGEQARKLTLLGPDTKAVGLRQALTDGHLMGLIHQANQRHPNADPDRLTNLALEVLRAAKKKAKKNGDGSFPEPVGNRGQEDLYLVSDLQAWERKRLGLDTDDEPESESKGA
ncbi:P-loop NTPase family protein [Amycolatopsis thermoflava]|uniref:hypothetical protein n=1 Tax=Amycolatopsis thermoflava TaxID=84480 RepID=UPI0004131722|nr:hypothetical protein [Amycolatopsis thermoflava]